MSGVVKRVAGISVALVLAGLVLSSTASAWAAPGGGGDDHGPGPFNWGYGFVGEKEGVEPGLLYRPPGMPKPFLANVINAGVLFGLIYVVGRKPIAEALTKRKERIVAGMEEAGKMKADAALTLAQYEERLKRLDEEVERIKREMREAAEAERKRIVAETKERRDRMERDAKLLVEQELKAARELLVRETVAGAVHSAGEILAKQLGGSDHDRLAREYLEGMQKISLDATTSATGARS